MMPPTAQLGVRWQTPNSKYWTELAGDIAQDADKLSDEDKLDTQRIPPGGTPGYAVLSFRTGFSFSKGFELAVSLENIFDKDYRIHGSGVNEPGRNLIITSNCTF
jgi:hemoglobin/transferrin/lactoferrin receptor protein